MCMGYQMDEDEKLLVRYFAGLGAPPACVMVAVGGLWKHSQRMRMFEYIIEHPDADYNELYMFAEQIYVRENKNAVCTRCGNKLGFYETPYVLDDFVICEVCFETKFFECAQCGGYGEYEIHNHYINNDGNIICEQCYLDNQNENEL